MDTFSNEDLMQRMAKLDTMVSATSTYINPYGPSVTYSDPVKGINESIEEQTKDIESLKDATVNLNCRMHNIDGQMWEIREKIEEALAIMKYPGLIANRLLDKVDQFIAKYKKVFTEKSSGKTLEVVEVSQLEGMMRELREVVKNGNNNEGL